MYRNVIALSAALIASAAAAQVNQKGTFQIGLGANFGAYATEYTSSYTLPVYGTVKYRDTDGAATTSFPLDLQYGLGDRFSLGLYVEPGSYLDSNQTRSNGFVSIGIDPRFYLINKDRFAWLADLGFGISALRIKETGNGNTYTDSYAGTHFRLGSQVQFYFGNTFGIHLGLNYSAHRLPWRDRDPEDSIINNSGFEATLRTAGIQFGLGAQLKF